MISTISSNNRVFIQSSTTLAASAAGNIGIGVSNSTAGAKLHTIGNVLFGGIASTAVGARLHVVGSGATSATTTLRVENTNASASLVVLDNGFVGVGTSTPTVALDVVGSEYKFAASSGAINFYNTPGANQHFNFINVRQDSDYIFKQNRGGAVNTTSLILKGLTGNILINSATDTGHKLLVSGSGTSGSLNVDNTLYVSGSRVGIGTATPANTLDVNGTARVSGELTVNGVNIGLGGGAITTNTRVGLNAGLSNTTGVVNSFFGYSAGRSNTTGGSNSFFGRDAGLNNTTGGNNSFFGVSAGYSNTTGSSNLFLGRNSGRYIADGSTANLISNNSIFLGDTSKALADNETNQIVIGHNAIGIGSNSVVLGNDSITTTALKGNVFIGDATTDASSRFQVKGSGATSATTTLLIQNSTPTNILTVLDNGTVGIGRTPTQTLDIAGTTRMSGSFNTAASGSILTVVGSGSAQPIFTVLGSQGELFSITDSLSGSLFSVNDISGLPILEVFSDSTTLIGDYLDPMLITTKKVTLTNSGSFTVYSLPTASYDTAFFDYSVRSGSNARAGQIMAIQSASSVNFTEVTSSAFGTTTDLALGVFISGSNMVLTGSAATSAWTIKTIIRSI
jgi:hypothetical protein